MKKALFTLLAALFSWGAQQVLAANTVTTVSQVTESVTVSTDVDYTITSKEPFGTTGIVDITNTDHAVVIIQNIKPSVVIKSWLKGHVLINGAQAVNGTNCQVKMYAQGAIIFPYAKDIKPLTVYSEKEFKGTAVSDFGLENTGGYMNTLTAAKLNNAISSFKLKRGYMVTFSTRDGGRGYSRCFIADKEDLEVSELPLLLDKNISSYRVFHWYNAKKAGLASDTRFEANDALNSSWCYDWGTGVDRLPDTECVPNHIYEDWPSSAACGSVTYSCHMKTNNEPGNSADDHAQSVETVLGNWENLMRTGLRLCSESSHDGSMGHLKAFIDSIDARGWRCDILDLHCYWQSGTFNNLNWYSSNYGNGRPIWISEWVWGASWNHNGFWGAVSDAGSLSEANQQTLYNGTVPILNTINGNSKVERYAYWNSEAAGTHIYDNGKLTKLGSYYANMNEGLGYNPANEFIPRRPPMKNVGTVTVDYDKDNQAAQLKWRDYNGEYNLTMEIQMQKAGEKTFTTYKVVEQKEGESTYQETIPCKDGTKFRIMIQYPVSSTVTIKNSSNVTTEYSNVVTALSATMLYGDPVTVVSETEGETTKYLGGNHLVNGDFALGTTDWLASDGNPIAAPYYQVMPEGGVNGTPYLQCYGDKTLTISPQTIYHTLDIALNTNYFVAASGINTNKTYQGFYTKTASTSAKIRVAIATNTTNTWLKSSGTFNSGSDDQIVIKFAKTSGKAMFDDVTVCQLFDTPEAALADALVWEKKRVEAYIAYNTVLPAVNGRLTEAVASATDANALEAILQDAINVVSLYQSLDNTFADAQTIIKLQLQNSDKIQAATESFTKATAVGTTATLKDMETSITSLQNLVDGTLQYILDAATIKNGSFAATTGWTTKAGTYTSGDQRTNTVAGKTCWNAWWSLSASGNEDKTMAVKQSLSGLETGLYALECKAGTQHLCETDQHAFFTHNGTTYTSKPLDLGLLDVESFSQAEMWRTMTTPYVYVQAGEAVTIGFEGSKKGAVDKSWIKYGDATNTGDNREGWWCATDFQLRFIPALIKEEKSYWGIVCSPYKISAPEGVTLYTLAGRSADSLHVYVKPLTGEPAAGKPYIYQSNKEHVVFTGSGTKTTTAGTWQGLKGTLTNTSTKYGTNSSALIDGKWIFNPGATVVPSNNGYIWFTKNLTAYDSLPAGCVAMPLVGYCNMLLGDVNGDGLVTMVDAVLAAQYFIGEVSAADINVSAADYNGDGVIDITDANAIANMVIVE